MAAILALGCALAGCGGGGEAGGPTRAAARAEAAYRAPPAVTRVAGLTGERVLLTGVAVAGARVRLGTPRGGALFVTADGTGGWRIILPASTEVRLFGLSMTETGRSTQAEGYLAVTPEAEVAQLRAGSGAAVLSAPGPARILAVDFDRRGGTVVSGAASPGASITVRADGTARGSTTADARGRFSLAFNEPLALGEHQIDATGVAGVEASMSPPAPTSGGPFGAGRIPGGWRIDWLTPGGGMQSTLLFQREGGR